MADTSQTIATFLKSRGWFPYYNDRYWCHAQFGSPSVDCTTRGMSPEEAYAFETDPDSRERTRKGMTFHFGAIRAFSNLGTMAR